MRLRRCWIAATALLAAGTCTGASFDIQPEQALLQRLLPQQAQQFELAALPSADGRERFRIASAHGHIRVEGSSPSALLFGVNWYLKYVAQVQLSPNGDRVGGAALPLPKTVVEGHTPYAYRYALNENVDGYTTPYWDWPHWQREIDLLALSGINALLIERGTDSVLYRSLRDLGYTDEETRQWIAQPAHQNWQLMGNLCCFDGPISSALLQQRALSAQRIIARLRELGITPVLPGFYGMVPADFQRRFAHAHVIAQGQWNGFTRPAWLDPRDPLFARLAAGFYRHQRELFGHSGIYDMEVFQEGGAAGDVPVPAAARAIQNALLAAHPGARWMLLAWQGNPRQDLLAGVDRQRLLIIDIDHNRVPRDDRQRDFQGAPFLYGGLWEYGGRTTLGANTGHITERLQRLGRRNRNMRGTAVFTEGMDTNPYAFDLFTEMAWRSEPVNLDAWTAAYVQRRYGAADQHAIAAWRILLHTAYELHVDPAIDRSESDDAQESLFDAQPSLDANRASQWSPDAMRYDARTFAGALPQMLQVAPALRGSETYQYDLVDIARQTLANASRTLLPAIRAAYAAKDRAHFQALTQRWLALMELEDRLLASNRCFLLGRWLAPIKPWASTPEERARLEHDARALLTTWGNREASEQGQLHDYGNRDWAGLTHDYYRLRWQTYFQTLDTALQTGTPPRRIDWFAMGEAWNHGNQVYGDQPAGDAYQLAMRVQETLAQ